MSARLWRWLGREVAGAPLWAWLVPGLGASWNGSFWPGIAMLVIAAAGFAGWIDLGLF